LRSHDICALLFSSAARSQAEQKRHTAEVISRKLHILRAHRLYTRTPADITSPRLDASR
jgi:hypothetical protein